MEAEEQHEWKLPHAPYLHGIGDISYNQLKQ